MPARYLAGDPDRWIIFPIRDETLVGGKAKGKGRGYRGNKTLVAGALQRNGQLRLERIPDTKRTTLHDFIRRTVKDEAEAIYTDELKSCLGIADENTRHETVNHSQEVWVIGDVHTNSIENVWSLFKRSIIGAFHKMSAKHMERHLEELEWRFNNRNNPHIFRDTLTRIMNTEHVTYRQLVARGRIKDGTSGADRMTDEEAHEVIGKVAAELAEVRKRRSRLLAKADQLLQEVTGAQRLLVSATGERTATPSLSAPSLQGWPSYTDIAETVGKLRDAASRIEVLEEQARRLGIIE